MRQKGNRGAANKIGEYVNEYVPGFHEEYSQRRANPAQRYGAGAQSMQGLSVRGTIRPLRRLGRSPSDHLRDKSRHYLSFNRQSAVFEG
jgi:hypothetical protein